ncbi:hypothetical protein [Litoreibacter roseus]|uniref:Uncharacterized protein n=1 Tax=Litoreibacter roseus TaxID=2601869 RepID=A0A6N6JKD7_9RHOB|nr:hypothetical protein [Litoreibacter roseus]GFE66783.1 hypothetical protein KIN_38570 [Litoreibacter roseus]
MDHSKHDTPDAKTPIFSTVRQTSPEFVSKRTIVPRRVTVEHLTFRRATNVVQFRPRDTTLRG